MVERDETVVALSKPKLMKIVSGASIFLIIGFWMLHLDAAHIAAFRVFNNPTLVHGLGVLGIAFFSFCGVAAVVKMTSNRPGLVLNSEGIFDNSSAVSAGFVPWRDIESFAIFELQKQKTLIVKVHNPEKYVERGNVLTQVFNRLNFKLCGSPIAISPNSLDINFDDLMAMCNAYLVKYRKSF